MSTRANIEFIDEHEDQYYIDRSHDGFPDIVLPDIQEAVDSCKHRWSGSEVGQLISYFLGINFRKNERIQYYEPCSGLAGDESYLYYVRWNNHNKWYDFGVY